MDKDKIKKSLTVQQVAEFLTELHAEPKVTGDIIISRTVCHNGRSNGSKKLYYYDSTKLFMCYSGCSHTFDIFELLMKVEQIDKQITLTLPQAVKQVAAFFGMEYYEDRGDAFLPTLSPYFDSLERYEDIKNIHINKERMSLTEYDEDTINHLPSPRVFEWEKDGISPAVIKRYNIKFNPISSAIVIPYYNEDGLLVGVRERTLIEGNEKFGKYKPTKIGETIYKHPLGFTLYGLDKNKEAIGRVKKAIVVESEKSVMQFESIFGSENNIVVALCGSNFLQYQFDLLLKCGAEEIIIGLDKQFKEEGDEEFITLINHLKQLHQKFGSLATISFLFDKWNVLGYKDSPTDRGREAFLQLFNNRISLY